MEEVSKDFLKKLTDQELADEFCDRPKWNDYEDKADSLVWKLCDRYDDETGVFVDVQTMEEALTNEMLERFVLLIRK